MLRYEKSPLARRYSSRASGQPRRLMNLSWICLVILIVCPCVFGYDAGIIERLPSTLEELGGKNNIPDYPQRQQQQYDLESLQRDDRVSNCKTTELESADHVKKSTLSTDDTFSVSNFTFPTPFDTSLGSNFTTQSCPTFFSNFLNNGTFQSCHAISLLLENSNSFFNAQTSAAAMDEILQASCAANVTLCTDYMLDLASTFIGNDACGQDYNLQNPLVTQAYTGMTTYQTLYQATCLDDPQTQNFCFTEAATNKSNAADFYVYYLPLGMALPAASQPTCNECLQATMQVFTSDAQYNNRPLSTTYVPAAEQIDLNCGPGFVNASIQVGIRAAPSASSLPSRWLNLTCSGYILLLVTGSLALGIL